MKCWSVGNRIWSLTWSVLNLPLPSDVCRCVQGQGATGYNKDNFSVYWQRNCFVSADVGIYSDAANRLQSLKMIEPVRKAAMTPPQSLFLWIMSRSFLQMTLQHFFYTRSLTDDGSLGAVNTELYFRTFQMVIKSVYSVSVSQCLCSSPRHLSVN